MRLELARPIPPEVPVGAAVVLQVRVLDAARNLRGGRIEVMAGEALVATAELVEYRDDFNETDEFAIKAPTSVGAFPWTVQFPTQEIDGIAYAECALSLTLRTAPHRTSLAVWGGPSPVRILDRLTITVGVKSSGAYALGGAKIEIHDHTGATIGAGILGDTPWPGTDSLHWTEVALTGPSAEGPQCWRVAFAATDLKLPHLGSTAEFGFIAVKPPEHSVAVSVFESDALTPVAETQIAVGPYRAATDKAGLARIEVPTGTYDLAVWKSGFTAASKTVEIVKDMSMQFELIRLPKELTVWD